MSLCLIGVAVAVQYFLSNPIWQSSQNQAITINFEKGMTANQLLPLLSSQQAVACPICLKLYFRILPEADNFKAGIYQLTPDIKPAALVEKLLSGDVLIEKVTITEGQMSDTILAFIKQQKFIYNSTDLSKTLLKNCSMCQFQKNYISLEGMFLADTYFFPAGSDDKTVLKRAHQALLNTLETVWASRAPNLPYKTPQQLLIAASIIEKETAASDEKTLVSAVIVNRLRKGMRLQMDPTVIYALGDQYQYPLKRVDLKVDNPFNTYVYKGLPPTPIANVGREALYAAAHPEQVNYLYFVAMTDGRHQFSNTLAQQNQAIKTKKSEEKSWQK